MPNPRSIQWAQLFELPAQPALPLQGRLRLAIVQAVLDGRLPAGAPLPSSRELARLLGLSRNTVTSAYLQLIDEDFLESRPRSGVYVARHISPSALAAAAPPTASATTASSSGTAGSAAPRWSARVLRSLSGRPTLSKPDQWRRYPYPFVYGTYDPQLFPTEDFRECCARSLARSQVPHWTPDFETDDVPDLVEQIRLRLCPKRGVFPTKDEILVTVGAQQAYYLLAEALFDSSTRLGLEEPGPPACAQQLLAARAAPGRRSRSMPTGSSSTTCRRSTTSMSRRRTRARRPRR
jgi:GntR family transcriptional regulator/MocR family aminotransferase